MKPSILVTGASGFVGRALALDLASSMEHRIITASRSPKPVIEGLEHRRHDLLDLARIPEMNDIDVVIHSAARVHVMNEHGADSLAAFRAANVAGTVALALAAAAGGAKRFVYVSSIKVNGEETQTGRPFTAFDTPNPQDPYGVSKWEAESALRDLGPLSRMEIVIVRPPLVYGPGVKGNFQSLLKWLDRAVPLPLGGIKNLRSLVGLQNLVDVLVKCTSHPAAAGQTFLVSDGEDVSTTELICRLASALGRKSRMLPVPESVLKAAALVLGKADAAQRLFGTLQVDIEHTRKLLDWAPAQGLGEGLKLTAKAYQAQQHTS